MQKLDDDRQKATAYLCKYITKDMELVNNRRRYWASKNLTKPETFINKLWEMPFKNALSNKTVQFENKNFKVHYIDRDMFVG